jgi:uncharacterized protein YqeY
MPIDKKLQEDLKLAMKAGEKDEVSTLRLLLAHIKNARIQKGEDLDDTEIIEVLFKSVKTHKESIQMYEQGGRQDLVDKENVELEIISRYLPEQLSEEQISSIISETINTLNLTSEKDIGRLMGAVMPKVKGKADGKIVQQLARSALLNQTQ